MVEISLIAGLLAVTGVALLFKSRLGTVLLALVLVMSLYDAVGGVDLAWAGLPRMLAGLVFLAGMVYCVVAQLEFHRSRGRFSRIAH